MRAGPSRPPKGAFVMGSHADWLAGHARYEFSCGNRLRPGVDVQVSARACLRSLTQRVLDQPQSRLLVCAVELRCPVGCIVIVERAFGPRSHAGILQGREGRYGRASAVVVRFRPHQGPHLHERLAAAFV